MQLSKRLDLVFLLLIHCFSNSNSWGQITWTENECTVLLDTVESRAILKMKNLDKTQDGKDKIKLYLIENGARASVNVSGKTLIEDGWIIFSPIPRLGSGKQFEADFYSDNDTTAVPFQIPKEKLPKVDLAEVKMIYPTDAVIPSNILFFNVEFSESMEGRIDDYMHVDLMHKDSVIDISWRQKSFWLDDGKLLILMIHPGRIKTGIDFKSDLSQIFETGDSLRIRVNSTIKDKYGRSIVSTSTKSYALIEEDREIPKILFDDCAAPNKKWPYFNIVFSEKMNYASILDGVKIKDPTGNIIAFTLSTVDDISFNFHKANGAWKEGEYEIIFEKKVADLANNRLNRLFEMKYENEVELDAPVIWKVKITDY